MSVAIDEAARILHGVEAFAWAACAMLALLVLAHTLGADFPARPRALGGELVVLGLALGLALAALRRVLRTERPRAGLAALLALVRLGLCVPALLFALVAAAAGFAA